MLQVILRRIPQGVAVILAVTALTFVLVNVLPGNLAEAILGNSYTPHAAAVLSQQLGLDHPLPYRYVLWLGDAVRLNFGRSLTTNVSVLRLIEANVWPTVELVIGAQLVAVFLGFFLALLSVGSRFAWIDRTITGIALFFTSMPSFAFAILVLAVFGVHWRLIPTLGWADPASAGWGANLKAIAFPVIALGLAIFPAHIRIFRAELYDQMENEEYVLLARMKGVSAPRLMLRHVARNSAFGLITVVAVSTAELIAGAVIIEQIFGIPGIGTLILTSVMSRDLPTVEACVALIAVLIVVFNLVVDLLYAVLDPRVRDADYA